MNKEVDTSKIENNKVKDKQALEKIEKRIEKRHKFIKQGRLLEALGTCFIIQKFIYFLL